MIPDVRSNLPRFRNRIHGYVGALLHDADEDAGGRGRAENQQRPRRGFILLAEIFVQ
jgi:hypothetical protein